MLPAGATSPGRLAENVMHFARVLRTAGVPVGSDRVQLALQALQTAGLARREDLQATLAACFLSRIEQRALFDQAFHIFWRDPDLLGRIMAMLLPKVSVKDGITPPPPQNQRLAAALFPAPPEPPAPVPEPPPQLEIEAALTFSDRELLGKADFDTMTPEEWAQAKRALAQLARLFEPLPSRRMRAAARPGRADWRATIRDMARQGGDTGALRFRAPQRVPSPLVVLADISGSMSRYSRMLLHFAHALGQAEARVESFVFGTRLTRTTRLLRQRDPDVAVAQVVRQVADWSGGTRITASLHEFNHRWGRRVLNGRATLLLITDGLEHGDTQALAFEMERLRKSCRRIVWVNPLLRYERFEPRAAGIRAMLPHVSRFLPAHNLDSLGQLAQVLAGQAEPPTRRT